MANDYPLSDTTSLKARFLGQRLLDLPTPSIVLDRSLIKKNCAAMLQICRKLDVGFRAHVKSHKTMELSRMQVGDGLPGLEDTPAQFIVSTIAEAENLLRGVMEDQDTDRDAGVSSFIKRRGGRWSVLTRVDSVRCTCPPGRCTTIDPTCEQPEAGKHQRYH
jgi:hypothetical protein